MSQPSLEDLAMEAKRHPRRSAARRNALTALIQRIEQELEPNRQQGLDVDVYEEAMQELFLYICKNIDKYQPDKAVIHWVRFILRWRKIDAFNFFSQRKQRKQKKQIFSGDMALGNDPSGKSFFDIYQRPELKPLPSQEVAKILKEDPEGLFKQKLFKKNPAANFQAIALMRLEEIPWKVIVEDLQIGETTGPIAVFYYRCCQEFQPKFIEYLEGGN